MTQLTSGNHVEFQEYFKMNLNQKPFSLKLFSTLNSTILDLNENGSSGSTLESASTSGSGGSDASNAKSEKKMFILLIQMLKDFTLDLNDASGGDARDDQVDLDGSDSDSDSESGINLVKLQMINAILTLFDLLLAKNEYLINCKSIMLIHLLDPLLNSTAALLMFAIEKSLVVQSSSNHAKDATMDNQETSIPTLLTQIIKNTSSFSMHLIMLACHHHNHASSSGTGKQLKDKSMQLFQLILMNACMSKTPKVRKMSTNIVKNILDNVIAPLKVHPYTVTVLDFATLTLQDASRDGDDGHSSTLDTLVFLRVVMPIFVKQSGGCPKISTKLEELCKFLLGLPAVGLSTNPILTQWVFTVLSQLFPSPITSTETDSSFSSSPNQLLNISIPVVASMLTMLKEMKPHASDTLLTPVWIDLATKCLVHLNTLVHHLEKGNDSSGGDEESGHQVYFTQDEKDIVVRIKEDFMSEWNGYLFSFLLDSYVLAKGSVSSGDKRGANNSSGGGKKGKSGRESVGVVALVHQVAMEKLSDLITSLSCIPSFRKDSNGIYDTVAKRILEGLGNVLVSEKWGDLLLLASTVFQGATACIVFDLEARKSVEPNVLALVKHIMDLRDDPAYMSSFPFKQQLDQCIQAAICGLGVDLFFHHVKLAIDAETGYLPNGCRRPYLLTSLYDALSSPTMKSSTCNNKHIHSLSFIQKTIYPLIQRMFVKQNEANNELEAKLYATMLDQCWRVVPLLLVPGHCPDSLGFDFCDGGWSAVVPILGGVVGGTIECVGPDSVKCVLKGLCAVIQRVQPWNQDALSGDAGGNQQEAHWREKCCREVAGFMSRFLAAVSNLYLTPPTMEECKNKGTTLQVQHERQMQYFATPISLILGTVEEKLANEYFMILIKKVLEHDSASVGQLQSSHSIYVLLDLMLLFMPFIQQTPFSTADWSQSPLGLFYQVLVGQLGEKDATLQKKTYKSLLKLFGHPSKPLEQLGIPRLSEFIQLLSSDSVVSSVSSGAIKNRVALFQCLVQESMDVADRVELFKQFIPLSLPEIMLATKEANEKTRDAAYDCLVFFAKYMMRISSLSEEESVKNQQQQLEEMFLMVTAGLGGESPHMQSAAIATLGRLFFEFHEELPSTLIAELLDTILITMSFKNREVTKAALGFIKVCVVCMDADVVKSHVPAIINSILLYTHRIHKSHFKSKTRHLFERLIRKFGYEFIDPLVPGNDKKLIMNIRKRREAAARRKIAGASGKSGDDAAHASLSKQKFEDAFHDSGSELGSDDEERYIPEEYRNENTVSKKEKQRGAKTVIHEDGDQVVDFLDRSVVSRVTHQFVGRNTLSTSSKALGKPSTFKTGSNGRILIQESDDENMMDVDDGKIAKRPQGEISEDYYKQSLASEVSFTRTADGRVKFLKRKRGEQDDSITTYENGTADTDVGKRWHSGYKKGKTDNSGLDMSQMLGRQYKAKKAKGDVKRAGMADPYAYIPLSGKIVGNMNKSAKLDGALKGILKASTKGSSSIPASAKAGKVKGFSKTNKKHNK